MHLPHLIEFTGKWGEKDAFRTPYFRRSLRSQRLQALNTLNETFKQHQRFFLLRLELEAEENLY